MPCGSDACELRQERLHPVGDLDDVRARLALHVEDDGALVVGPAGELRVLDAVDDVGDVGEAHRRAVRVGEDQRPEAVGLVELIVGRERVVLARAVEVALGLVDVGGDERAAHVLEGEARAGERRGIDLHAHRGLLAAVDA